MELGTPKNPPSCNLGLSLLQAEAEVRSWLSPSPLQDEVGKRCLIATLSSKITEYKWQVVGTYSPLQLILSIASRRGSSRVESCPKLVKVVGHPCQKTLSYPKSMSAVLDVVEAGAKFKKPLLLLLA